MDKVKVIVLSGDGINCENETSLAFNKLGCDVNIIHINDLTKSPDQLLSFQILAIPGGFSFGDELGSGQILSLKLKMSLEHIIDQFIQQKGVILGICNGFQTLVKWLLTENTRTYSLAQNKDSKFINQWVECEILKSNCIWTKGLEGKIHLPARHGEGRFFISGNDSEKTNTYKELKNSGKLVLKYSNNINGSEFSIAGITDKTGQILGLMPHPEAATNSYINPFGDHEKSVQLFKNAIHFVKENRRNNA